MMYVLYGCETWSLTLEEEHMLRVFANRVLRWEFLPIRTNEVNEDQVGVDSMFCREVCIMSKSVGENGAHTSD
jgi:hypothetical protein